MAPRNTILIGAVVALALGAPPQRGAPAAVGAVQPGSVRLDEYGATTNAVPNDNRMPAGRLEDGTLLAHLEARTAVWRPRLDADTSIAVLAFAEAGQAPTIPGPLIRVPQGAEVRLTMRNDVPPGFHIGLPPPRQRREGLGALATDVLVVHGLPAGTVGDDTVHVRAGETREVRFRADRPGTYLYWGAVSDASMTERTGRDAKLAGVIIVGRRPSEFASPGPPLILTRDETTEITVLNGISEATSIHWHGMELGSVYDGVAGWGRSGSRVAPLIAPGDSFIVQMTPPRAGTYMYHTHMGQTDQLVSGMYGPLLVLEPDEAFDPETDLLFLVGGGIHEGEYYDVTLNGRMEPAPRTLRAGPIPWMPLAVDGADLPPALQVEHTRRLRFAAGQTFDFQWTPTAPGSAALVLDFQFPTEPGFYVIRQPFRIR